MRFSAILLLTLFLPAALLSADLIELIKLGEVEAARREAARREAAGAYSVNSEDGRILYGKALLESDGKSSLQFLTVAARGGITPDIQQEILYRTALYYLCDENYVELSKLTDFYLQEWPNGEYWREILRFGALSAIKNKESEKAERMRSTLIKESPDNCNTIEARIDFSKDLFSQKKYTEGRKAVRRAAESKCDDAIVPALYLLTLNSLEQKEIDNAILSYNLLKDGYPDAVGLEELEDRFSRVEKTDEDRTAEKITGTFYSVQVGVFSKKENALKAKENMVKHGQPIDIKEKIISGKTYYVVYVGRFQSSELALNLKHTLEASANETFQVVAR
jgi:hypothetical protein